MMPLIFVVDGVPERRNIVQHTLEDAGYRVEAFATTRAADSAEQEQPALFLVALELPDGTGVDFHNQLRRHPILFSIPVLLLADSKIEKYRLLEKANVEGCVSFPFAPGELVKTVETILRSGQESTTREGAHGADIVIDPFAMKISVRGKEVTTTTLEFRLLDYLARHQGKVFTRDALLDAVWGDLRFVTPRSVDACIRRIRRKIEPESSSPSFLRTIRGVGYKLEATSTWEAAGGACPCPICTATRERAKSTAPPQPLARGMRAIGRAAVLP
jgi:two-component system phosphate regulon response regulator PhoB